MLVNAFYHDKKTTYKVVCLVLLSLLASGCAIQQPTSKQHRDVVEQLAQLKAQQTEGFAQLDAKFKQLDEQGQTQVATCIAEFKQHSVNQQALIVKQLQNLVPDAQIVEPVECPELPAISESDKLTVGEIERIVLSVDSIALDARVDTGAETSSLGVFELVYFERDGKEWLKFSLVEDTSKTEAKDAKSTEAGAAKVYEFPIVRFAKIKQQGRVKAQTRPVIEMIFSLGDREFRDEFTLADRKHLQFQALLGRSFLKDIAVVDISRKYVLTSTSE